MDDTACLYYKLTYEPILRLVWALKLYFYEV